jgi:acyl-coenzyme A thioesterase PaaI-like protein
MSTVTVADLVVELPYNHHLGLKAVEGPDGSVLLPGADYLKNHVDSQHAGALFSVAEAASGVAMMTALGDHIGEVVPLVAEVTARYLKVARGPIIAKGTLAKPVEALLAEVAAAEKGVDANVEVVLRDQTQTVVAEVTVRWRLKKPRA